MRCKTVLVLPFMLILGGCGDKQEQANTRTSSAGAVLNDIAPDRQGEQVYLSHCAECHGQHGEGAPNWRIRNAAGKFPPPPLNGSGHTWHHPLAILRHVIKNGSPGGKGDMPAWKDKLSDQQIDAVIDYVQSWWPKQVRDAWLQIDTRSK